MMTMTLCVVTTALVLTAPPNPNKWEHTNTTDGVQVFVRDVPGSDVREVKSISVVPAPPARVFAVVMELDNYVRFMPYVQEARIIKRIDDNSFYGYQKLDPPMVSERDYTLRYTTIKDPANNYYRLSWDEANDKGPAKKDGVVRLEICKGWWSLEPEQGGQATRATYWLYTDPGGSIPSWIANKANTSSLPDLHSAIRKRSLNPTWTRD